MATAIQWRRGTTAQHANFTGLVGEITVDTDLDTVVVHDGSTAGGHRLAKYSEVVAAATGDITDVVAGSGLTGGAASGSATLSLDYENLTGNLVPSANNTYSLGSLTNVWKDVYVGPGSLYVNGQKVLEDNSGTIQFSADSNQNISILTTGAGDIEVTAGGQIQLKSDVVLSSGKTLTASGGLTLASNINMNSNNINNVDDPVAAQDAATKAYVDAQVQTKDALSELTGDTDDVAEGSVNLYFTDARADARIAAADTDDLTEGSSNLYYTSGRAQADANIAIGNNTTDNVTEGPSNLYFTTARANTAIDDYVLAGTGINVNSGVVSATLAPFDTDDLAEGATNQYYTVARAESAIDGHLSGGSGINYSGGAISVDGTVVRTSGSESIGGDKTFSDDVTIAGNLTVSGTTVTVNTETLFLEDNIITLNYGTTGTPTQDSGLQVDRGDAADVFLKFNETSDQWQFTNDGSTYYKMATDTDDLAEGSNLYFTDARARGALSAAGDLVYNSTSGEFSFTERTDAEVRGLISVSGDLSYNSSTGVISYTRGPGDITAVTAGNGLTGGGSSGAVTVNVVGGTGISVAADSVSVDMSVFDTDDVAEGSTNLYFTNARADARIAAADTDDLSEGTTNLYYTTGRANADFDTKLAAADTGDLSEGTNLYYTDARADARVNLQTGSNLDLSQKSTSDLSEGTNQYYTDARARGAISVSGDLSYNSTTGVISYSRGPGDITAVTAGSGLTGGGSTGSVTLNIGAGNGIDVAADNVAINASYVRGLFSSGGDITYNSSTGQFSFTNDAGDIESVSVTAGAGLTGGGSASSGAFSATLNIGAGTGINVAADSISVDMTDFSTSNLTEGSNLYYTEARADARVNAGFSAKSTSDLSEGSNLYYTAARANAAIDARVTNAFVDALNVDADTLDGLNSTAFLRSNANDSHSGTITPSTNNSINLGSSSLKYANVYATTFQGQATSATYADLAEKYATDAELEAGTVVCFGGDAEVTECAHDADHRVAGVISTDPAYMMNASGEGQYVALTGRVPCKVTGPVAKGDLMVSSSVPGHAKADNSAQAGRIIGKAVGSSEGGEAVIEVLVNMM